LSLEVRVGAFEIGGFCLCDLSNFHFKVGNVLKMWMV